MNKYKLQRYCNYRARGANEACGRPISSKFAMCLAHITMVSEEMCVCGSTMAEHKLSDKIPCKHFISIWTEPLPLFSPLPQEGIDVDSITGCADDQEYAGW